VVLGIMALVREHRADADHGGGAGVVVTHAEHDPRRKPAVWAFAGVASLIAFAWLPTLVEVVATGRVCAVYGGIYIAAALVRPRAVEGGAPGRWDLIGGAVALLGAAIISGSHAAHEAGLHEPRGPVSALVLHAILARLLLRLPALATARPALLDATLGTTRFACHPAGRPRPMGTIPRRSRPEGCIVPPSTCPLPIPFCRPTSPSFRRNPLPAEGV
jgi:drug/metabolite transporter superfamily protein YnfA